ncbi:MAG TPA: hypothetical protein VHM91_24840, partial [Verrucomicrobiales bacterium]|nr:hypothetical protein [Verrucomicrobiales bacterium]
MKPLCPKCRRVIPAEHVNMEKWVLLCPDCGELFPIPRVAERDDPVEISRLPRGITLSFAPGGFMIKANLRSLAAFFIVPFTIAWA